MASPSLRDIMAALAPRAHEPDVAEYLSALSRQLEQNPLLGFEPHAAQSDFIQARTPVVAAFAGNRFGKSTALGVCALREALPREVLPELLRESKRFDGPTAGWIMLPTEDKIDDSFRPVFQKWCPPSEFLGGNWGKAFNGDKNVLRFKCGSTIHFKTYKQDPSTLGGAGLHWIGYDEPPPKKHREEGMWRLGDHGGFEMFAMTPLDTNTAYVRREIYKKRASPDITVVTGSVHDNPTLNKAAVARAIGATTDIYVRAREFGEFVDIGGLIYPDFERCLAPGIWEPSLVRSWDVVVGIDPGIRNAGIVFVGFDGENTAHVFDALLLQDSTPADYARAIRAVLARWAIKEADVQFVVDPAARQRGQSNAETVASALAQESIYCNPGQNDVQTGIGQLRTRMAHQRFWISPERSAGLLGLREEADEYAAKEPTEGKDDSHMEVVKSNDHRLDALRYCCMERFWDHAAEDEAPRRTLGFDLSRGMPLDEFRVPRGDQLPMGSMM